MGVWVVPENASPPRREPLIPEMGHGPFDLDAWKNGGCFDDLAMAFFRNPAAFDDSCVRTMRPPPSASSCERLASRHERPAGTEAIVIDPEGGLRRVARSR